jgi:hypothetical protein
MRHVTTDLLDAPPVILVDRRRWPERRAMWRGGRRDSDWTNRPLGALARLERELANGAKRRPRLVPLLWWR